MPIVVELDPQQSVALERTSSRCAKAGSRSNRSANVRIGYRDPGGLWCASVRSRGFLDDLSDEPKQRGVRERVWASLACHSVAVAGERSNSTR